MLTIYVLAGILQLNWIGKQACFEMGYDRSPVKSGECLDTCSREELTTFVLLALNPSRLFELL
jgi:hypothetical protein